MVKSLGTRDGGPICRRQRSGIGFRIGDYGFPVHGYTITVSLGALKPKNPGREKGKAMLAYIQKGKVSGSKLVRYRAFDPARERMLWKVSLRQRSSNSYHRRINP